MKTFSKKSYIITGLILLVLIVIILLFLKSGNNSRGPEGELFTVKSGDVTNFTEQTGILKAQVGAIVKVGTRATGTLVFLKYQIGDMVEKGELIAQIDDREILANLKSAEAQVMEQKQDIGAKEAEYQYSKTNYEREKRLLEKGFTTRDSVDKAKRELDVARAVLELTKAKLNQAQEKLRSTQVSLSYTKIYAPISGYVSAVTTQQGETVVSGLAATSLITIIDPTKLEMWIYVDETDIGKVRQGMKVEYWVDAYRERRFYGNVNMIYPQPEIKDNIVYYLAIVKIDPKDAVILRPEMTTHVRIIVEEKKGVLVVPNNAVKFESGMNIVYVKEGRKTYRQEVRTGVRDDRHTEIKAGLKEGNQIIIPSLKKSPQAAPKK